MQWIAGLFDVRDGMYLIVGLAMLGLTLQPVAQRRPWFNLPSVYLLLGALGVLLGLPTLMPFDGKTQLKVIEHASELIVIVSLAGVGLAIDTKMTWSAWRPALRLLLICMPLTILFCVGFGRWALGMPVAAAMLLGAVLAPTDPVLARSVQVGGPGKDEPDHKFALTGEAGLNDGLAFPFVYLAIAFAAVGLGGSTPDTGVDLIGRDAPAALGVPGWLWGWFGFDVVYRIAGATVIGLGVGHALGRLVHSRIGDARFGAQNSTLMVLASTFLAYGAAEAVDAYGFIAVFLAARAGRDRSERESRAEGEHEHAYNRHAHHAAEQIESVLLAVLLLWFGSFLGAGGLSGLTLTEAAFTALLLLVARPLAGWLSLFGMGWSRGARWKTGFFGIRGMGSIFYLAYAQTHADIPGIEQVWRVVGLTIAVSIVVHGFAAGFLIENEPEAEQDG